MSNFMKILKAIDADIRDLNCEIEYLKGALDRFKFITVDNYADFGEDAQKVYDFTKHYLESKLESKESDLEELLYLKAEISSN